MKKGFFSLLGLAALIVALMPTTSFAATTTRTAQSHHAPHVFLSKGHKQQGALASQTTSGTASSNLVYQGGPVIGGTTNVYAIFWEPTGNVSSAYNGLIQRYFNDVGSSPLYQNNQQYTDAQGKLPLGSQLAGTWVDSRSYPTTTGIMLDSDIQAEVTHAQQVNAWSSSINNIFIVFTERNENVCTDSTYSTCTPNVTSATSKFCAYHSFFGTNTLYATIPYAASFGGNCNSELGSNLGPNSDDADLTINLTSHEQIEAVTDPLLNAWQDSYGNEIGDKCAWLFGPVTSQGADVTWNNNPYLVQQEWDNAISGCTLSKNIATKYYEIVNRNSGLVMDVYGGGTTVGAQVIQWTNHNGANQQWQLVPDGQNYQIVNRNSGLVLDVYGGGTTQGANVIQWTNHNGLNQQWQLVPDGGYDVIVNVNSNLIMDVYGGGTTQGANVIQWTYHNGLNQQWALVPVSPYYEITNVNSGLAMDVYGGGTTQGANVIQWPYHNGLNQQWAVVPDGQYYQIVNLNSGLVMDVYGGGTTVGARVIQWANHNGLNQQWQLLPDANSCLSGNACQIVNRNSGLVLDVYGGGTTQGVNVIQWTNHNGLNQQWKLTPTSA